MPRQARVLQQAGAAARGRGNGPDIAERAARAAGRWPLAAVLRGLLRWLL
jgi:hypothetical protein